MRRALVVIAIAACAPPPIPVVASRPPPPAAPVAPGRAPAIPIELPKFLVPPPIDPVIALSSNIMYGCAVRASGAVDCWGTWEASFDSHPEVRRLAVSDAIAVELGDGSVVSSDEAVGIPLE